MSCRALELVPQLGCCEQCCDEHRCAGVSTVSLHSFGYVRRIWSTSRSFLTSLWGGKRRHKGWKACIDLPQGNTTVKCLDGTWMGILVLVVNKKVWEMSCFDSRLCCSQFWGMGGPIAWVHTDLVIWWTLFLPAFSLCPLCPLCPHVVKIEKGWREKERRGGRGERERERERAQGSPGVSLYKGVNPLMKPFPLWPHKSKCLPEDPPPNINTLEVRVWTFELSNFGGT
jgi:hypothetical protein